MTKDQEYKFIESEHMANFHDKFQEGCSECFKENRLINSRRIVNSDISERNYEALHPMGGGSPWDRNPLE